MRLDQSLENRFLAAAADLLEDQCPQFAQRPAARAAIKKDVGGWLAPSVGVPAGRLLPLWEHEMFLPITMVHKVKTLDEAMLLANRVNYGLTAGFYGNLEETSWFFENIQAGVAYANRPQGATTGAWPGFQPFGGWKGSGSTGKNAGGHYYLPLYLREQIQTLID